MSRRRLRLAELIKLYETDADGCCDFLNLSEEVFDTKFRKIAVAIEDDFLKQCWDGKLNATTLHQELFNEHFTRLRGAAMQGFGQHFSKPRSMDEASIFQNLTKNATHFSAAKQQAMIEEIDGFKKDAFGKIRSRTDWEKAARGVTNRHNGQYLKAEIQAASASASSAERWHEFQKRKHIYPNVKYQTVGDARVRDEHRALDGAVYPIDHPFWDKWWPPNGWKCRCIVLQTDDEVVEKMAEKDPPKDFANNSGKTGKLFGDDHPYFSNAKSPDVLFKKGDLFRERLGRDEVESFVLENAVAKKTKFTLPTMNETFEIHKKDIDNVFRHPHGNGAAKNELLYALSHALKKAVFVGSEPNNDPRKNQSIGWFYFLVEWLGEKFVLNFERMKPREGGERIRLYAIKDDLPYFSEK